MQSLLAHLPFSLKQTIEVGGETDGHQGMDLGVISQKAHSKME